jgi:hypothetical protein
MCLASTASASIINVGCDLMFLGLCVYSYPLYQSLCDYLLDINKYFKSETTVLKKKTELLVKENIKKLIIDHIEVME